MRVFAPNIFCVSNTATACPLWNTIVGAALTHAYQPQTRKATALDQREHIDAISGAAALHEQNAARAAEIGAGEQRHALLLGRQRNRMHSRIGERTVDQDAVSRIRHVRELRHIELRRSRSKSWFCHCTGVPPPSSMRCSPSKLVCIAATVAPTQAERN
jgi:hypothetical protein